jgi:hypothetical protein
MAIILNWKEFSFTDWSNMTFQQWDTFVFEPSNPILTTTNTFFGTLLLKSSVYTNGSYIFNFGTTTSGIETTTKLLLGGIPLTLARIGGKYAIQYITTSASTKANIQLTVNGNHFYVNQDSSYNYYLTGIFNEDTENYQETIFYGTPLAVNSNKNLIVKEKIGTPIEYTQVVWNGTPLKRGRIGSNWYLMISEF